ncbi:hypothetical protein [Streptomyces sp. NPDC002537]
MANVSVSPYTLHFMTVIAGCTFPFALAYQAWAYRVFRRWVYADRIPATR